jgi:hypothetical protein
MIRILTLLVSLFTFGLVQLAEINYEIPVTDMLYFNDTPIEDLNGLTLNEVFIDSQLLLNPNFDNGITDWTNTAVSFIVIDGIANVTSNSTSGILQNINANLNDNIYLISRFKTNGINTFLALFSSSITLSNSFNNIDFQINSAILSVTNTTNLRVYLRALENYNNFYDYIYAYNLTLLGIDSLTQLQLDRYYQLWQNPELNITYQINELDTQDLVLLLASQSVWTIMIHLLYKYAYRPKKKFKRLGM